MAYISIPSMWRTLKPRYRLIGAKCRKCGMICFPPRRICMNCGETDNFEEVKLSGRGKVYSYTIIARGATVYEHRREGLSGGAFPIALIELEEGIRVLGQITDCKPEEVRIGMEVEVVFRRIYEQDGIIRYGYKFRPVRFRKIKERKA